MVRLEAHTRTVLLWDSCSSWRLVRAHAHSTIPRVLSNDEVPRDVGAVTSKGNSSLACDFADDGGST